MIVPPITEADGRQSVKSAARLNGAVVLFVDSVENVVASGVVINETFVSASSLFLLSKKVTLCNVLPFISDDILLRVIKTWTNSLSL